MSQHRAALDLQGIPKRVLISLEATYTTRTRPAEVKTYILTKLATNVQVHLISRAAHRAYGRGQKWRRQLHYVGIYANLRTPRGISQNLSRGVNRMSRNALECTQCCNAC